VPRPAERGRIDAAHLRRQALGDPVLMAEILRVFLPRLAAYVDRVETSQTLEALCESLRILGLAADGVGAFVLAEAAQEARDRLERGAAVDPDAIERLAVLAGETAREAGRMIAGTEN
jgi:hypothetical protein